jgi:single-strand DNA-binding protein
MSSVNKVILLGRVGADPEIRTTTNGDRIANLRLATSESWRDKASGEKKEKTEWSTVVCFNDNLTKVIENYVKKGSLIYIEGQLQTRKWEKDGVERYSTEVVLSKFRGEIQLLGGKGENESAPAEKPRAAFDLDDDIPAF